MDTLTHPGPPLQRAVTRFTVLVASIRDPSWGHPTPCAGWSVRQLVNHVAVEDLWAGELFAGRTIADVGARFDGDQLGAVPAARFEESAQRALAAAGAPDALTRTVHLSFGDVPGAEYARQLFADHLVHAWDLATALGVPAALDPHDVRACLDWFTPQEGAYRSAGLIGPRPSVADDANPLTQLLASFGRTP